MATVSTVARYLDQNAQIAVEAVVQVVQAVTHYQAEVVNHVHTYMILGVQDVQAALVLLAKADIHHIQGDVDQTLAVDLAEDQVEVLVVQLVEQQDAHPNVQVAIKLL